MGTVKFMESIKVKVVNRSTNELPEYKTPGSAGMDLRCAEETPIILHPGERTTVGTGLHIQLPHGYKADVRPRSGLAIKHGVTVLNTPGLVDEDYTGEVRVILINLGQEDFEINYGDRIAQLVVTRYEKVEWVPVDSLEETERGDGGFGHSGVK